MTRRILLIEDDSDSSAALHRYLTQAGYFVTCIPDGRRIVQRDFELPDAFIIDNGLPTIDGIALCKFLKLQGDLKGIPVILTSDDHQVSDRSERAGATLFVGKPFHLERMSEALSTLFGSPVDSYRVISSFR